MHSCRRNFECAMRTVTRALISVVAGFFLMWPLGYLYDVLNWPTFHSWGLLHGGFFSAWPTLSIFTFLALGYVRFFPRVEDTPLWIVGLVWGLLLTGFLGVELPVTGVGRRISEKSPRRNVSRGKVAFCTEVIRSSRCSMLNAQKVLFLPL